MRAAGFVPIPRNRPLLRETRQDLDAVLAAFLATQRDTVIRHLLDQAPDHAVGPHVRQAVEHLDLRTWHDLISQIQPILARIAQDGAEQAMRQIRRHHTRKAEASEMELTRLANERAEAWAEDRAAELVGMTRLDNGVLVEHPNPRWAISDSTRSMIREMVESAIEDGESTQGLAGRLERAVAFSRGRAETIARTETAYADVQGNLIGYTAMGVEKKESLLSDSHDAEQGCDCAENAEEGPIDIDALFQSGDDAPPYHPNCECDLLPVIADDPRDDTP